MTGKFQRQNTTTFHGRLAAPIVMKRGADGQAYAWVKVIENVRAPINGEWGDRGIRNYAFTIFGKYAEHLHGMPAGELFSVELYNTYDSYWTSPTGQTYWTVRGECERFDLSAKYDPVCSLREPREAKPDQAQAHRAAMAAKAQRAPQPPRAPEDEDPFAGMDVSEDRFSTEPDVHERDTEPVPF